MKKLNIILIILLIISLFDINVFAVIPLGANREDQQQYTVYPQDYATGTGTDIDPWAGNCIEDAYNAASAGDTIYLRAGYYELDDILSVAKSISFIGEGIGKTIVITADAYGFRIDDCDYVTIKDMTIDGDAQTDDTEYISPIFAHESVNYLLIENVEAKNGGYYGIGLFEVNNAVCKNIYMHDNAHEGFHPSTNTAGRSQYNTYQDIYCWDNGCCGFNDRGSNTLEQIVNQHNSYSNIKAWDNSDHGITINYQSGAVIDNCIADGNGLNGFNILGLADSTITNCVATLNSPSPATRGGFHFADCDNVIATGLISYNNYYRGINLEDCYDITLANCKSYDDRDLIGTDIAFVDGGEGADTITQSAAQFLVAGFEEGEDIVVTGSTSNDGTYTIVSVAAGTITLATGELAESEEAGDTVTITQYLQLNGLNLTGDFNTRIKTINCDFSPNKTSELVNRGAEDDIVWGIVNDDLDLVFGTDDDWLVQYDEGVDNQLLFLTAGTGCTATTDAMYQIIVGATPTADQQVFGVAKGTQASKTQLFSVDEDGDFVIPGTLSIAGETITMVGADTLSITTSAATAITLPTTGTLMANLEEDTDPDLGGQLQAGAHSINFTEQVLTSGTAVAWNLGNSNKAILTAAHNPTITITAPTGALNAQVIITQDGTGSRILDEIVTQSDATIIEAEVHIDTEIIDLTVDIPTGARIRFKTSGVIPTPLVADTIYYAIRTSENHIQVATTKALAIAGTAVNISDDGTDTQTVQQLVKWSGGTLGVLTTDAGAEDILALTYKTADKQWYAQLAKDFQ